MPVCHAYLDSIIKFITILVDETTNPNSKIVFQLFENVFDNFYLLSEPFKLLCNKQTYKNVIN